MMTTGQKWLVAIGAVGALAGVGTAAYFFLRRRSSTALGSASPQRIEDMQAAVWDGVRNPQMRELALAITGNGTRNVTVRSRRLNVNGAECPARDGRCESDAVGRWVTAHRSLAADLMPVGADSSAALTCTLLSLNGITCRFRLLQSGQGDRVYSMAGLPKNRPSAWSAVDVDAPQYRFGTEPGGFAGRREDFDG